MGKKIRSVLRTIMITIGAIALVMIILAFTPAPFWIWYNLGVKNAGINRPPDYIVIMGGGGMPSHSALIRCWYAAGIAGENNQATILIALPGDTGDHLSSVNLMKQELVLRGVAPERIIFENTGTNTRAQALNVHHSLLTPHPSLLTTHPSLLLITSPEHLSRAVLTFKKAGFLKVDGVPAFEKAIESELGFDARELGSRSWMPDVGGSITLRYQFWKQIEYEFLVLREYFALAYYKLQGWI